MCVYVCFGFGGWGRLGDSITEGTLVQWCKAVGDEVAEDEVIAVVETDKVSVDVRSAHVGVVVKLFAAVDDAVSVCSLLFCLFISYFVFLISKCMYLFQFVWFVFLSCVTQIKSNI